jgi:RNA 2',3'-cyclic 3'-phosphodiesterase
MRLFLALEIPAAVKGELARRLASLGERLLLARSVRWVRPEAMHLTLCFFGEVEPSRIGDLGADLGVATAAEEPVLLRVQGAGFFPLGRPARVLWAGVHCSRSLVALGTAARAAGVRVGASSSDGRPFRPHLTLARCRRPWNREDLLALAEVLDQPIGAGFLVTEAVLFESRLGRDCTVHVPLGRFAFATA